MSSSSVLIAGSSAALGRSLLLKQPTGASSTQTSPGSQLWATEWTGCFKDCLCFCSSSSSEKLKPTTSGEGVGQCLLVVIEAAVTIIVVIDAVFPVSNFS